MSLPNPSMDFTAFDVLTADQLDDMVENVEALAAGTGLNNSVVTASKLATGAQAAYTATDQGIPSAAWSDLATVGPAVTVTIGVNGLALINIVSGHYNSVANNRDYVGFAISGASTQAAADIWSASGWCNVANFGVSVSGTFLVTGLAAGSTTFTLKYRTNANQGNFYDRRISVVPL